MKILLVIDQFFDANNGMTISARRFAAVLEQHGHEIRIVSTGKPNDTEYLMQKQYIPFFDKLVASQGMTFAKTDRAVLTRAIEWAEMVHFLVPFKLTHDGIMIARALKKPYTAAFHVQPENITSSIHLHNAGFINTGIYKWFNSYVYKYCRHIHCPSNFIASEMRKHGYTQQLHVISNGIDPDFVYRKLPKTPQSEGRFLILTIGRLSVEKRQDIIIKAASKSRYSSRLRVMIAGQGPRLKKLKKLAARCGVDVVISFYPKQQLLDLIAMCDLYVHAADAEIEAMSCMEAFSSGLVPVIADSEKSATPQFALDERSLFTSSDADDLARRIDYWIEHTQQRKEMEYKYAELGKKYKLDECVLRTEMMFAQAVGETETI